MDVAGGVGGMLAGILESAPALRGTLFDQPSVIEQAKADRLLDLRGRCDLAGGDLLESVPAGADAYIMKHIIHDWGDARASKILQNCRRVMKTGGKDPGRGPGDRTARTHPDPKKFFDVAMMLMPGGRERTESEWHALFAASGLRGARIVDTQGPLSIIEGVPA